MTVATTESSSIKSIYELTPLDGNPSSRTDLQFVLFYRIDGGISHETSEKLRAAFFQAFSHYPILYGRIKHTKGVDENSKEKVQVVCEHGTAEHMISYKEYMVNELVEDIQRANYNWAMWPAQLLSVCPIRGSPDGLCGEDPLVQCVITRHADGMGILLSVDHLISDGIGIEILLKQWAGIARSSTASLKHPQPPPLPVDYDHKSLYEKLHAETPEDDWFVQHVDSVNLDMAPKESGAMSDSDPRETHQVELAMRANVRVLRITPESLERLYQDATNEAEADQPTHIPVIRLAYALLWQRYMAALSSEEDNAVMQQDDRAAGSQQCFLNVIHSARHLVGRPHYIRNAVCPVYMQQKAVEMQKMTVGQLAVQIGQHMHVVTRARWLGSMLMLQDAHRFRKFLTVFANPSAKQLSVSNISRLGFFEVDFGFGAPVHVTVYPMLIPGFSIWLPLGVSGGLHILWNMSDSAAARLRSDPLFTKYVDFPF
ncbi:hypothetical protein COEREDRAFT_98065 [Coemansia reversa NRRL 1564]|uniref:Uncharacterized protein n=1 Tax=Coemansia reversa (strain ATCC 12441 / NRRL 1564) TaxID=763665 RepID=A0A2G5B964_COERN|nr:hypothetical protein COEREDRAFT_98065 [Coemansia reversa NRRL 1564]|eukprot:PIA15544.1 hypothetical protein COEREDRAFT_98065 [Coemansia reversa NRRL 1564]